MKALLEQHLHKELKEQLVATFSSLMAPAEESSTVEQAPGMFPGMSSVGLTAEAVPEPSEQECSVVVADIVAECRRTRK